METLTLPLWSLGVDLWRECVTFLDATCTSIGLVRACDAKSTLTGVAKTDRRAIMMGLLGFGFEVGLCDVMFENRLPWYNSL